MNKKTLAKKLSNRTVIVSFSLVILGLLLLSVGYLYGKNQSLENNQTKTVSPAPQPTLTSTPTPEPSPEPTPTARIIYKIITPTGVSNKEKIEEIDKKIAGKKQFIKEGLDIWEKYINAGLSNSPACQTLILSIENAKREIDALEKEKRSYQ